MRSKYLIVSVVSMMLLVSCGDNALPAKTKIDSGSIFDSPIITTNLDKYMFRDDVQYVDLRPYSQGVKEGYIKGFEFIPFHKIVSCITLSTCLSYEEGRPLYHMERINNIALGAKGSFVANYEESESMIKYLFRQDKNIFLITHAGSENMYMFNLLYQLGYDMSKVYNVGGVNGSEGVTPYFRVEGKKYYVEGKIDIKIDIDYSFLKTLTPIEN